MKKAVLLVVLQQRVTYLHGFLAEQQSCENLSLAVLFQTDENNIASSHHQTASWSSQRDSPAHTREGEKSFSATNTLRCGVLQTHNKAQNA